jgi:hypothetical protein
MPGNKDCLRMRRNNSAPVSNTSLRIEGAAPGGGASALCRACASLANGPAKGSSSVPSAESSRSGDGSHRFQSGPRKLLAPVSA